MNSLYDTARFRFATAGIDWRAIDMRCVALSGSPDFVPADMTLGNILARSHTVLSYSIAPLTKAVAADGSCQTGPMQLPAGTAGTVNWMVLVQHNAVQANAQLIEYIDEGFEIPFEFLGLPLMLQPDWSANRGWFKL